MKKHVTIAACVLVLAASAFGEKAYSGSQDAQSRPATTQPDARLSKKERKRLDKEEKKARKQERKEEKHHQQQETKKERKQYQKQEKEDAKIRRRELKDQQKQVAAEQKKENKYERKEAQRAERRDDREMNRQIARESRVERAAAVPAPRYGYVPRIPISTTATPGLLLAQREVSRTIYSQLPSSNVRVLLDGGNQILLRGSAPSPSLRQRLLQLAVGAARGYSVVDQLAANFVGDAAGAATSAAIGGVSDLIHGSGRNDAGPDSGPEPMPESAATAPAPVSPQQALPNSDSEAPASVLEPGSNACVNLSSSTQVLLTGQVASQPSADLVRQFARQLASPSASVVDQLAVRTNGLPSSASASASAPDAAATGTPNTGIATSKNSANAVSPGSTVCVTENNGEMFLTGTVGSTAELGTVESAVQPLLGNGRLLDHLTIANMNSGTQTAASTPISNPAPPPLDQQTAVEQAVHSIPRLANVDVQVTADGVHLSGSVDSTQDDQIAADLARQYAPGRPVVDNMMVANRTQPPPQ